MDFLETLSTSAPQSWELFAYVWREIWFVLVPAVLFYMFHWYWIEYQTTEWVKKLDWVSLAITVPPDNEQSPKVMEEFFNALHAAHSKRNFRDTFWDGSVQEWFSLEIVGVDGDVQFIIRTPRHFKDLVEAHLYAQFPNVEIREVPDYAENFPNDFDKQGLDLFGAEMVLTDEDYYPIRTYPDFEHQMTQRIIDPISTVAEVMNKLRPGEQIWVQFLIRPILTDWSAKGQEFAKKLMGLETPTPTPKIIEALSKAGEVATSPIVGGEAGDTFEEFPTAAFLMPPNERKVVENVERNVSKLAYEFKNRVIYLGRKEVFHKPRFNSIIGAFKQFNTFDMNSFKPYKRTMTRVEYFHRAPRIKKRKHELLRGYKQRSFVLGAPHKVLTTESLASLFHIPDITVKAPRLPRTLAKKGSAPANLPVGSLEPVPQVPGEEAAPPEPMESPL